MFLCYTVQYDGIGDDEWHGMGWDGIHGMDASPSAMAGPRMDTFESELAVRAMLMGLAGDAAEP